jgi:hypothetical protein
MKRLEHVKKKTSLILLGCILFLCAGFIVISCGTKPQKKVAEFNAGPYAIDFNECPAGTCRGFVVSDVFDKDPSKTIAGKELTIEGWIKSRTSNPNNFTGAILGRFDTAGIVLFVNGGEPKAAIRRVGATGTATATADYIVSSGMQIVDNVWHHVAAVLTAEDHSAVHADCGDTDADNKTDTVNCPDAGTVCNNNIHFDIYVDGAYKECNTTYGQSNDTSVTHPEFAGAPGDHILSVGVFAESLAFDVDGLNNATFPGVIDEVRLWGTARTQNEIQKCMNQELSLDGSTCGRVTSSCIAYLKLNEGSGGAIYDWCGLGSGVLEYGNPNPPPVVLDFTQGWTKDTPNISEGD